MVGCPFSHRDWIIDAWFEATERALVAAGVESWSYAFVGDNADPTWTKIEQHRERTGVDVRLAREPNARDIDVRDWRQARYGYMVTIRNMLLDQVRDIGPDVFFSIDSDILVADSSIADLLEDLAGGADAAGSCTFLSKPKGPKPSHKTPSCARSRPNSALNTRPYFENAVYRVDVLMAFKAMSPAAYACDYRFHHHGEDIGWSQNCAERGLELVYDTRSVSKHVMSPDALHVVDLRCGY